VAFLFPKIIHIYIARKDQIIWWLLVLNMEKSSIKHDLSCALYKINHEGFKI